MKRINVTYNWASDTFANDDQGVETTIFVRDHELNDHEAIGRILARIVAVDLVDPEMIDMGECEPADAADVEVAVLSVTILEGGFIVRGRCIDGTIYAGAYLNWEEDRQAAHVFTTREEAQARVDAQHKKNGRCEMDHIIGQLQVIAL